MLLTSVLVLCIFLSLSALFSSSETAFLASNPYTLDLLEKKGSKRAGLVKRSMRKIEELLATILFGNTLVNAATASVATYIFSTLISDQRKAVLLATITATVLLLIFGEINPKTYAVYHPVKVSLRVIYPIRLFHIAFYPIVRLFTILPKIIFGSSREQEGGKSSALNEEEVKLLLTTGLKGLSALRGKMISGILDIGARPIKEIIVPRPQVKAIEVDSSFDQIIEVILSSEYSRYPVFRGRMDNIEGLIHAKDVIPYLVAKKEFQIRNVLRRPFFIPESASLEKALLQMQENAVHLALVVDEFGSLEGIVTLEDILEEIVGEIRDEHDDRTDEEWFHQEEDGVYTIKGKAPVKEIHHRLRLDFPDKGEYTTLAGFLLFKFGRIPHEKDILEYQEHEFIVEKMIKRHISLVRVKRKGPQEKPR